MARVSGVNFGYMRVYTQSDTISEFEAAIAHISFRTRYSPKDWKVAINTMIEKKEKGNLVKDLYTINLMEVDFNFNNKILAHLVMKFVEETHLIPEE